MEDEAWFLAAAESLRGQRGLPETLCRPNNPESIKGAKEWLKGNMPESRTYSGTVDQPALTALFDFAQAKHSRSFQKLWKSVQSLLTQA